jgi:hypothetical protein
MNIEVKMDFTRKAQFVTGGHMTNPSPSEIKYSSVVSRISIRIGFLIAALNGGKCRSYQHPYVGKV